MALSRKYLTPNNIDYGPDGSDTDVLSSRPSEDAGRLALAGTDPSDFWASVPEDPGRFARTTTNDRPAPLPSDWADAGSSGDVGVMGVASLALIRLFLRKLNQCPFLGSVVSDDSPPSSSTKICGGARGSSRKPVCAAVAAAAPEEDASPPPSLRLVKNTDASSMMAVCDFVRTCPAGRAGDIAPGGSPEVTW